MNVTELTYKHYNTATFSEDKTLSVKFEKYYYVVAVMGVANTRGA